MEEQRGRKKEKDGLTKPAEMAWDEDGQQVGWSGPSQSHG